jgi:hypothetical protein
MNPSLPLFCRIAADATRRHRDAIMSLRPVEPERSGGHSGLTGPLRVMIGIVRLARFDASGIDCFAGTVDGFLTSLSPWAALSVVAAALTTVNVGFLSAIEGFLIATILLLAPAVLSHFFAELWKIEAKWLRYATAFNWSQVAMPIAASLWLALVKAAMTSGLPEALAGVVAAGGILGYALALNWFLIRHGLGLSAGRSALLVVLTNLGTVALVLLPWLIGLSGADT